MSMADDVYRRHLDELKYPVPTGLSKLADQVTKPLFALANRHSIELSTFAGVFVLRGGTREMVFRRWF